MERRCKKEFAIGEICKFLDGQGISYTFHGNEKATVRTFSNLQELQENGICLVRYEKDASEKVIQRLRAFQEILVVSACHIENVNCIVTADAKVAFFFILNHFFATPFQHTISKRATVLSNEIGENVHIAPGCYVGEDVRIGDNTILHPNVVIECPCQIGRNCEIFPGVVIGEDGFGYDKDSDGVPHREIHHKGVIIGDNVEIGANSCIDRGLLTDVVIEDNVKIGNLCHVGHDVYVERNTLIVSSIIICGSSYIKRDNYLAPGSIIYNSIIIGERAKIGIGSVAMENVEPGATIFGNPGRKIWNKNWLVNRGN